MKKVQTLTASIIAIIMCLCLIAGSTLAVFTKQSSINISVMSGHVSVLSTAKNFRLYSAEALNEDEEIPEDCELIYENGNSYYFKDVTGGRFLAGGTAVADGRTLILNGITAGDKIDFDIEVTNNSNIAVQYYADIQVEDGEEIFGKLDINFDGAGLMGKENVRSEWTTVLPTDREQTQTVHATIAVPLDADGEQYQGKSLKFKFAVFARQYTVSSEYIAEVNGEKYATFEEAVENAEKGGVVQLLRSSVIAEDGIAGEEGEIVINKSLTVRSAPEQISGGTFIPQHTLYNAHIKITDGAAVVFENLGFEGTSFVNVSGAGSVKFSGCEAIVSPYKIYDSSNRKYVDRAAFIVSDETNEIGIKLVIENSRIFAARAEADENSAAIYISGYLADGSVISGNQFGGAFEGGRYASSVICLLKGMGGAKVKVTGNGFYGSTPMFIGKSEGNAVYSYGVFTVQTEANTVESDGSTFAEILGNSSISLLDKGSLLNGVPVTCDNITALNLKLFYGVNIEYDGNFLTRGTIKLGSAYGSLQSFLAAGYTASNANMTLAA